MGRKVNEERDNEGIGEDKKRVPIHERKISMSACTSLFLYAAQSFSPSSNRINLRESVHVIRLNS